ncbi:MAG: hypothetical protein Q9195_006834 [Heterodermia aff. obscurata]
MVVATEESNLLQPAANGNSNDSIQSHSHSAPTKRKADNNNCSLSQQKPKRCRKKKSPYLSEQEVKKNPDENSVSNSCETIPQKPSLSGLVGRLKYLVAHLEGRRKIVLEVDGFDLEHEACGVELRDYLRLEGGGYDCWPCPAPSCSKSYGSKSHMKTHVVGSSGAEHKVPREAMKRKCDTCRDAAVDDMIRERIQVLKRLRNDLNDQPEVIGGRKQNFQVSTPAIGSNFQGHEKEAVVQEELDKVTPEDRQQARISRTVEDLSRTTRSDTEEESWSGHETDTSESADLFPKRSITASSPGSQVSNKDRDRRFSSIADSDGALAMTSVIPRDHVVVTRSDGETEGISKSPAVQSKGRPGSNTQGQPGTNLDLYHTESAEIIQRRKSAGKARRIPGSDTQVPLYLPSVSCKKKPDPVNRLIPPHLYQPNFGPGRQVARVNANDLGSSDWELVSSSEYGPSEHHQYWASAGVSQFANQSLGLACDGTAQWHPHENFEAPVYSNQSMQPDGRQPFFYQLPEQAEALGAEYYGTKPHQVPHQQIQNCFHNGWMNQDNYFEQQNDTREQKLDCSRFYNEQDPSIDGQCASKCGGWYERRSSLVLSSETGDR